MRMDSFVSMRVDCMMRWRSPEETNVAFESRSVFSVAPLTMLAPALRVRGDAPNSDSSTSRPLPTRRYRDDWLPRERAEFMELEGEEDRRGPS
jgi:hypothetical protein